MPRYFFHLEGREERIIDRRGQILPNENAALGEAKEIAAALRKYRGEMWWVIVTNEWGHEVTQAPTPIKARLSADNVEGRIAGECGCQGRL